MKETITIKNFGGLKDVTIPLNSINIFIGKQASGKSVTAKLIYFFRKIFEDMFDGLYEDKKQREINEGIKSRFKRYFPVESWSNSNFSIQYKFGDDNQAKFAGHLLLDMNGATIRIDGDKQGNIKLSYPKILEELEDYQRSVIKLMKNESFTKLLQSFRSLAQEKDFLRPIDFKLNRIAKTAFQTSLGKQIQSICPQTFVPSGRSYFSNIQNSVFPTSKSWRNHRPVSY